MGQPSLVLDSEWTLVVGGIKQAHLLMSQFGGCFSEIIPAWLKVVGTPQQTTILAWFGNHLRIPHSAPHSARCLFVPFVHFVTAKDNIYELLPKVFCSCGSGSEHNCRFGMPVFLCPVNTLALGTEVQSPLSRPPPLAAYSLLHSEFSPSLPTRQISKF